MTTIVYGAPIILYSPYTSEQYSATKGDYFDTPKDHVFKDSEGNNMVLAQTEYNELGNLGIKKILKHRVRVSDLLVEDRTRREIEE